MHFPVLRQILLSQKNGLNNWKKALEEGAGFSKHQVSGFHREAVFRIVTAKAEHHNVGYALSDTLRFLCRQSIALRGNWDDEAVAEIDSNFYQTLKMKAEEDEELVDCLGKKDRKYTSPDIQNEISEVMACQIISSLAQKIHAAKYYTIMADETADVSNIEQLVVCLRWVSNDLEVHEDFIELYPLFDEANAETITDGIFGSTKVHEPNIR